MLTTPKDPPGSASSTADSCSSRDPEEPDPARESAWLRHEVALLRARKELEEERAAPTRLAPLAVAGQRAPRPATGVGTVASWMAHDQLGVAVEVIGEAVARALGVVPKAERALMSEAVTEALVKSARDHLDRAAAAEISGVHRTALERACMAALDRQAQLSIDEARRRNSLEAEADGDARQGDGGQDEARWAEARPADAPGDDASPGDEDVSTSRPIRVLVTDDPLVADSDWRAQHLAAQIAAHETVLRRLNHQAASACNDLETTLDCWVRGAPPGERVHPSDREPPGHRPSTGATPDVQRFDDGELTPEERWRAQAGIADAAAATASEVRYRAGAGTGSTGGSGTGSAGAAAPGDGGSAGTPAAGRSLTLRQRLLEMARSDVTTDQRTASTGPHELVVRGAASLASNLGPRGTVIADELTVLNPAESHLMTMINGLLRQRADLASSTAALAGIVSFARSLAGLDNVGTDVAPTPGEAASPAGEAADGTGTSDRSRATVAPGLQELARQALLHERLVTQVVESLTTVDRDLCAWVQPGDDNRTSPVLAAIGRERLHTGTGRFTHVLVLQNEGLTADVVTRHSIVGASGRLAHIGSATVSWLLIDVASGAVVDGGQSAPARTLIQDTSSGRTSSLSMTAHATTSLPWAAQRTLEFVLKCSAVTVALASLVFVIITLVNGLPT